METAFWLFVTVLFNESFILANGSGFWLIINLFVFIRSFFLLVDTVLEILHQPIFEEEHYFCLFKSFSWFFADIPANEKILG